jgi:hypothetical protein
MRTLILAVVAALSLNLAQAVEVAGVKFEDKTSLGNASLVANGAGLRKKAFFKVYAMALYLPEKQAEADGALSVKGAKRIAITLLRDLSAQQFVDALQEGVASNHSESEMAALTDRMKQFSDAMLSIGEAKTGSQVFIDLLPDGVTRLTVNGQVRGSDLAGEDFFNALLKIWLGNKPVQDDLKQALLGKTS